MSALVPHPWDQVAPQPPPGRSYEALATPVPVDEALKFARLWRDITEAREEAERLEDEADAKEREAEGLEDALKVIPGLADAIGEDPYAFDNDAEIMAWAAGKGGAS